MKYIIFYLFTVFCMSSFAQVNTKADYNWCFGSVNTIPIVGRSVINFQTQTSTAFYPVNNSNTVLNLANTSISDTIGNLLFYSNYYRIVNKNHAIMQNGDSLNYGFNGFGNYPIGGAFSQSVLALPSPDNAQQYYVFHLPNEGIVVGGIGYVIARGLWYSKVDMAFNNGLGKVTQKNIPVIFDTLGVSYLTACRHANGRDWWILAKGYSNNQFHKLLLSPNGIQYMGVQNIGMTILTNNPGRALFSPDGKKYILALNEPIDSIGIYIYDFDRCNGILQNTRYFKLNALNTSGHPSDAVFSPNSRYLYFTSINHVFQLDTKNPNIGLSQQLVATNDGFQDSTLGELGFLNMQLAPDNKIYISTASTRYFHTIESPDSAGIACNVQQHSFKINKINSYGSMPNFPHYRLGREIGSACDTIYTTISPPQAGASIQVYPNPAQESVTIELPQNEEAIFSLLDIRGRVVLSQKLRQHKETISLGNLAKGMYFYRVENEKGIWANGKLVKE